MSGSDLAVTQVISGLGGIGKTQTVLEYIRRHGNDFSRVLWASAEDAPRLANDFLKIAPQLLPNIPDTAKPDDILRELHVWLENPDNAGYLLVLDNADFNAEWTQAKLKALLPVNRTGKLLLTSRNTDFPAFKGVQVRRLDAMTEPEALELFDMLTAKTLEGDELEAAKTLAKAIEYLPLAVEQIAAFIRNKPDKSFRRYLKWFEQYELEELPEYLPRSTDYPKSLQTVWNISLEAIRSYRPEAIAMLEAFAFLDPDWIPTWLLIFHNSLPESPLHAFFANCKYVDEGQENAEILLLLLIEYSLITAVEGWEVISVHRMVQAAIRHKLSPEERHKWIEWTTTILLRVFPDPKKMENWEICKAWIPTILVLVTHIDREKIITKDTGSLLNQAGVLLDDQARYAEALLLYERGLAINEQALGAKHPETATSLNNLAYLYQRSGRYAEALPLHKRALEIREQVSGLLHTNVAQSLNNLALLYESLSRYEEALPLHERALAINKKAVGEMHPQTATSLNNLATLYASLSRYEEALPLHKRALEIREQTLGAMHPDTANSLNNLGYIYYCLAYYEEARPLYERSLAINEYALGAMHPQTATNLNSLAELDRSLGRCQEALPLHEHALSIREQALGLAHPDTANSLNNLALVYDCLGRYEKALPLYERALAIRERVLGAMHPDTAISLNNLAGYYENLRRYEEALPLFERSVAILLQSLGEQHPTTQAGSQNLMNCAVEIAKTEAQSPKNPSASWQIVTQIREQMKNPKP